MGRKSESLLGVHLREEKVKVCWGFICGKKKLKCVGGSSVGKKSESVLGVHLWEEKVKVWWTFI